MKIKFFIWLTALVLVTVLFAIIITNWNKHIIFLTNGDIIEAEKTWVVFDEVYYEKGMGTLDTVNIGRVERIVSASLSSPEDWKIILSHEMAARRGVFALLTHPMLIPGLLGLAAAIAILLLTRIILKFLLLFTAKKQSPPEEPDLRFIYISSHVSDFKKVLLYFLNLYLLQSKAKKDVRYAYRRLDNKGPLSTTVYEYKILQKGRWQSRRISIGLIGEDSGARSKCFYVIYDDHFVVKMPPEPVTDFKTYIESIQADRRIADILAPRECLVPKLSIVLKKIPDFAKSMIRFQGDDEQKSLNALEALPRFKSFLKIGGSYAFFMDLSEYFFLGHILHQCHDITGAVDKEFHKYQDMIWIPDAFANRYGENSSDLCFELQNIFNRFDQALADPAIPEFQKKAWFNSMFVEKEPVKGSTGNISLPAGAVLEKIQSQYADTLLTYKRLVEKSAHAQLFKQNIVRTQNICSRLVELLAWLFFKNVAIRDLKPDNILVAGDPSKYPQFLSTAAGFELGLIDVEIAVCVGGRQVIEQPKLGWTPFYATPSHMFINNILETLFDDIAYIFKLQDWHAIAAIIYQAVTGNKLFEKTAGIMASMGNELPQYFDDHSKMMMFAKKSGAEFWASATAEFEKKLEKDQDVLKSVDIEVFKNAQKMFGIAAEKSGQGIRKNQLSEMPSHISAYDLINIMFEHIRENMFGKKQNI